MSERRMSGPASFQSSVSAVSAEELSEKYQKLFQEFSKIKAQHSILKKAVLKEQARNTELTEQVKVKEQDLRNSIQQLDLLTFHNQRLTKRIESLQDASKAVSDVKSFVPSTRLTPGWLVGSAKKELEKSKYTLETTSVELGRKIEENEMLTHMLYETKSLYDQDISALQTSIAELEKKNEELEVELSRSNIAGDEAMDTLREEKQQLEKDLEETKAKLKETTEILKESERARKNATNAMEQGMNTLGEMLLINLGLNDQKNDTCSTTPESKTEEHDTSASLAPGGSNTLEKDTGRVEMSEGDATRESLIKKHYESKIQQLNERLQLTDSTSVRMVEAMKFMKEKLAVAEKEIARLQTDNKKCKEDLGRVIAEKIEADGSYKKEKDMMTDWINDLQAQLNNPSN
ncbi:1518_t:CDS:10 [Paraglomus brasilianum]|uniref:1518_t:CDS:1 n=1 Tax=Paraglomus brasilianum TaxID=144538 RepID=A0A9N9B3X5_9GLOM|nr:1518_t:CDS:10 [Paraglomus brasilianum]